MQGQPGCQTGQPYRWPSYPSPQMLVTELLEGIEARGSKLGFWGSAGLGSNLFCYFLYVGKVFPLGASISYLQNGFTSLGCYKGLVKSLTAWQ